MLGKKRFSLIILLLFFAFVLNSQESNEEEKNKEEEKNEQEITKEEAEKKENDSLDLIYKGEQHLYLGVGMLVPVFMHFYNNKTLGNNGFVISAEHYEPPLGLTGYFEYKHFLNEHWAVGAQLGGSYSKTSENAQTLIHAGFVTTFMIRKWPVDIPISLEIGGHFNSLKQESPAKDIQSGGFFIKPEIGFFYNIDENWGVGGSMAWWVVPEIYTMSYDKDNKEFVEHDLVNQSTFAHSWALTLNVRYRFQ